MFVISRSLFMKKLSKLLAVTFLITATQCTQKLYKQGCEDYNKLAFSDAIPKFEKYLAKKENADAEAKLAHSYRLTGNISNAEIWYAKVVSKKESAPVNMFYYGKMLMGMEKYEEAKKWLDAYTRLKPNDFVAEMLLVSCNSITDKKMELNTELYTANEVEMPDTENEFAQIPHSGGIIFSADKLAFKRTDVDAWTGRSYVGLYFSKKDRSGKWMSPVTLRGDVNGDYHEGPACFSADGETIYFTRNNFGKNGKLVKNAKNENTLKIYTAVLKGDQWTDVKELAFNSDNYSCAHPSLSSDGKYLYFISDMPGSIGGTDIYRSELKDGTWQKPENLGSVINTESNEMFPYIHKDGTLYFSSEAHKNMGGLDVFMTSYDGTKWLAVENLNYPINTSSDDFAFVLNDDKSNGFISSNRTGEDKIFELNKKIPVLMIKGVTKQVNTGKLIDSVAIEIRNLTERSKEIIYTNKNGQYQIRVKPECEYVVHASKAMYFLVSGDKKISTIGKKVSENFIADFELDPIIIQKPIVLKNIYYDLDKWNIRTDAAKELDKLVEVLVENPNITIELSSHTDSRAGDQYNLVLSDKRARAATEYIISRGINRERLKAKGYGEKKILNKCSNGVICSEEEHQLNRRTEFKVIKITNTK